MASFHLFGNGRSLLCPGSDTERAHSPTLQSENSHTRHRQAGFGTNGVCHVLGSQPTIGYFGLMKYRTVYSLSFLTPPIGPINEVRLSIQGADFVLYAVPQNGRTGKMTITIPVDPAGLSVRVGPAPLDDGPRQKGIHVPESTKLGGISRAGVRVLSFVLDVAIDLAHLDRSFIPESEGDEARLKELGSLPPFVELHCELSICTRRFENENLDMVTVNKLLSREVGLAIYSDALRLNAPIGRFRELWRVLESAFGQKNSDLVTSLVSYPPAVKLKFDHKELTEFLILRGRASHSESSAGLDEYHDVSQRVETLLPRLECLAEEVLLTKKTWGIRGAAVERLAPLRTYIDKNRRPVVLLQSDQ
jgi:hypothetical protein